MKILLVEDNKELSAAIIMRLKSYGYQTLQAPDAVSALSVAIKQQPDLAIVDINLPGGSGFTVMDRMAQSPECPDVPVIVATASKEAGLREKARQHGASAFLEKPFSADSLLTAIQDAREDFH
jgi:CheY-like chemotaxis protein